MKYQIQLINLFLIVVAIAFGGGIQSPALAGEDDSPGSARFKEKFDTDGDGVISEEEKENFRAHMRDRFTARGPGGMGPGMDRASMLEKFDADGDGTLSEAEKEEAHNFFQERRKKFMAKRMEKLDTDGDGKLSQEERAAAREQGGGFRKMGDKAGRYARGYQDRVKRFDADGDGVLSEDEKAAAKAAGKKRRAEMISRFDTDGDGELSKEEREAMRESRPHKGSSKGADVK